MALSQIHVEEAAVDPRLVSAEREKDGRPLAWIAAAHADSRGRLHFSGIFEVSTRMTPLLARQDMGFMNVAGKRSEFAVNGAGEGDGRLGDVRYETADGTAQKVNVFWDEPMGDAFKTVSKTTVIPADALRLTALELYRSNGKERSPSRRSP